MSELYPHLYQLLGAYLHQDFAEEFDSAEDALNAALADADSVRRFACLGELRIILSSGLTEAQLAGLRLCDYDPAFDGFTYRGWLEHILQRLTN